jgi:hypothetical protein
MDAHSVPKVSSIHIRTPPLQSPALEDAAIHQSTDTIEESEYPDSFRLSAILIALVFSIFLVSFMPDIDVHVQEN